MLLQSTLRLAEVLTNLECGVHVCQKWRGHLVVDLCPVCMAFHQAHVIHPLQQSHLLGAQQ